MRAIEEVSGESLSWFWRGWLYTTELLDQGVAGVEVVEGETRIHLRNEEGLVMPVLLHVEFADGTMFDQKLPAEVWMRGDEYTWVTGRTDVVRVFLDPDFMLPDIDRSDNEWRRVVSE